MLAALIGYDAQEMQSVYILRIRAQDLTIGRFGLLQASRLMVPEGDAQ